MTVSELNSQTFRNFVCGGQTVVIDVYKSQCHYCDLLAPVLEKISNEKRAIRFGRINGENAYDIINTYNIGGVPVLLIFRSGQLMGQITGFDGNEAVLRQNLQRYGV